MSPDRRETIECTGAVLDNGIVEAACRFSGVSFRRRRQIAVAITLSVIAVTGALVWGQREGLADVRWLTGWALLGCLGLLILLGVRRRLPVLPLGNVSTWTQVHLYTGAFAVFVYVLHVPTLLAGGVLEGTLSILFVAVSLSGFYGLFASRTIPKRLTAIEGRHRFDQVGWCREDIRVAAESVIREIAATPSGDLIRQHFDQTLQPFFAQKPSPLSRLVQSDRPRRGRLMGLRKLNRYVDQEGRRSLDRLTALVRHRDDWDEQFVLQFRLRAWVVLHGTLSLILLVLAIVHAAFAMIVTR